MCCPGQTRSVVGDTDSHSLSARLSLALKEELCCRSMLPAMCVLPLVLCKVAQCLRQRPPSSHSHSHSHSSPLVGRMKLSNLMEVALFPMVSPKKQITGILFYCTAGSDFLQSTVASAFLMIPCCENPLITISSNFWLYSKVNELQLSLLFPPINIYTVIFSTHSSPHTCGTGGTT